MGMRLQETVIWKYFTTTTLRILRACLRIKNYCILASFLRLRSFFGHRQLPVRSLLSCDGFAAGGRILCKWRSHMNIWWSLFLSRISRIFLEYTLMMGPSTNSRKSISNMCDKSLKLVKNMASALMQINALYIYLFIFLLPRLIFGCTVCQLNKLLDPKKIK